MSAQGQLPSFVDEIEKQLATRRHGLGAQVFVAREGHVLLDAAFGAATPPTPMRATTLHNVWCATKPILAVEIVRLSEHGRIALDEPIEAHLGPGAWSTVTVRDCLNHAAGLRSPNAGDVRFRPRHERAGVVRNQLRVELDAEGRPVAAYSEFAAWHLLARMVERAVGEPIDRYLRDRILLPLGIDDVWFTMTADQLAANRDRVGVYFAALPERAVPMLHDRVPSVVADASAVLGGYTTMRSLGSYYQRLLDVLDGTPAAPDQLPSAEALAAALRTGRPRVHDAVLDRPCSFAAGFMVGLDDHHFGTSPSPRAFGHVGWLGASFAFADPSTGVVAAMLANGMHATVAEFEESRPRLIDALHRDLDLRQLANAGPAAEPEARVG